MFVIGGGIYTTNKDKFDPTKSLFENMLSVLTPPKDDSEVQSDESVVEETIEPPKAEPIVEAMIDDDEPAPVTEDGNVLSPVGGPPPSVGEIAKTVPVVTLIEDEPEEPEEKLFQPDWLNMDGTFKNNNYYRTVKGRTPLPYNIPYVKDMIETASGNYLANMEQQPCDYLVTNFINWVKPNLETSEVERIVQSCNAGCKTPFDKIRRIYDNYEGAYFIDSRCETHYEIRERRAKKITSVEEEALPLIPALKEKLYGIRPARMNPNGNDQFPIRNLVSEDYFVHWGYGLVQKVKYLLITSKLKDFYKETGLPWDYFIYAITGVNPRRRVNHFPAMKIPDLLTTSEPTRIPPIDDEEFFYSSGGMNIKGERIGKKPELPQWVYDMDGGANQRVIMLTKFFNDNWDINGSDTDEAYVNNVGVPKTPILREMVIKIKELGASEYEKLKPKRDEAAAKRAEEEAAAAAKRAEEEAAAAAKRAEEEAARSVPCGYSDWSEPRYDCLVGKKVRERTIEVEGRNVSLDQLCDYNTLAEVLDDNVTVDCVLGPWEDVTGETCSDTGYYYKQQRKIITPPKNNGKACGDMERVGKCEDDWFIGTKPKYCVLDEESLKAYKDLVQAELDAGGERRNRILHAKGHAIGWNYQTGVTVSDQAWLADEAGHYEETMKRKCAEAQTLSECMDESRRPKRWWEDSDGSKVNCGGFKSSLFDCSGRYIDPLPPKWYGKLQMCKTSSLTNREDDVTKYKEKYVSKKIVGNPEDWKLKEGKGPPTDTGSTKYMNACVYIDRSDARGKLYCDYDDKLRINKCRDLKEGESSNVKSYWSSINRNTGGSSGGSGGYTPPTGGPVTLPVSGPVTLPVSGPPTSGSGGRGGPVIFPVSGLPTSGRGGRGGPVTLPVSGSCPPVMLTLYYSGLLDTDYWKDLYKRYSSEYSIYTKLGRGDSISSNNVQIYINRYNEISEQQWKHKDSLSEQELNDKAQKYKLLKSRFQSYANCMLYRSIPVTTYINKIDYVIKIFEPNSQ